MTSLELAREIAHILDDKKATEIKIMNIGEHSSLGDYFVLASGSNLSQTKALCDEIEDQLSKKGLEPRRIEGYQSASWILLDYVDVIVHIFYKETREFYSLERLWADVEQIEM